MEKTFIDGHVVEGIFMLDDDTCVLDFVVEREMGENNSGVVTEVQYWLDDDSWHFYDLWYDSEGDFIDSYETESERLSEDGKKKCMEMIKSFIAEKK